MSLTVLFHDERPIVIVRWFLDSKGLVLFACGPIVQMENGEFRAAGHEWVTRHFQDYARVRLPRDKIIKPFESGEAKEFMADRRVMEIHIDHDKNLIFSPMVVEHYSLENLNRVKPIVERAIPISSPPSVFWEAFDRALADAPLVEPK